MKQTEEITRLKRENRFLLFSAIVMFLLFISILMLAIKTSQQRPADAEVGILKKATISENAIVMKVPAVDREGNGVLATLAVEASPGNGRILVDINSLLFFTDTQESIVIARKVAEDFTKVNFSNYDLIYTIAAQAESIGGPSAGAALTIATIAAVENITLREDVGITGRILPDGSIGEVSGIAPKAEALKSAGVKLFLVPPTEGTEVTFETSRKCEEQGNIEVCTIEKVPTNHSISEKVGIEVKEVSNIQEVFNYFVA